MFGIYREFSLPKIPYSKMPSEVNAAATDKCELPLERERHLANTFVLLCSRHSLRYESSSLRLAHEHYLLRNFSQLTPMKFEKTQPGNPHQLTIKQHVIPVRTIERFAAPDGMVEVNIANQIERLRPYAGIFWTRRAGNQRAERGYMKQIEDKFQTIVNLIVSGELTEIPEASTHDVNQFYSLWFHRSRIQPANEIETQFNGLTGNTLTKDEQEALEARGIMFVREGGKVATRDVIGMQIQARIMMDNRAYAERRWGVIHAPEGEFIKSDVPAHELMPITPTVMLAANHPSGLITRSNLTSVNIEFLAYTRRYFFGRDLKIALADVTEMAFWKAVKERDQKLQKASSSNWNDRRSSTERLRRQNAFANSGKILTDQR
jgi:hypothetical protein